MSEVGSRFLGFLCKKRENCAEAGVGTIYEVMAAGEAAGGLTMGTCRDAVLTITDFLCLRDLAENEQM